MRIALALTIGLAAFVSLPAQAASPRNQQIVDLLNQAVNQVYKAAPHCKPPSLLSRNATLSDADPSQDMLNMFAFLRRPATAEEAQLKPPTRGLPADGIYRRYIRVLTSASGRKVEVFAAQNVDFYAPRPQRCIDALRRDYARLIDDRPQSFKHAAQKVLDQIIHDEWDGKPATPTEGMFLGTYGRDTGALGGGGDLPYIRTHGMWIGSGGRSGTTVDAVLPDGVASVTVRLRLLAMGPNGKALERKSLVRTAAVRDNAVSIRVNRRDSTVFPDRITWYAADGSVLRTVK